MFWVLKITVFELLAGISLSYDENTCDRPVNVLKNSPKISDLTKRDVSQLNLSDINEKLG